MNKKQPRESNSAASVRMNITRRNWAEARLDASPAGFCW